MLDALIVGGGPAGLTASIYLARFHLEVMVIDAGNGRAQSIPLTRNHAGFPEGISGPDLLARMRSQAAIYGVEFIAGTVDRIERRNEGFVTMADGREFVSRSVLVATGVFNHRPPGMSDTEHDEALARGLLRYCPVCDGYEVTDRKVAVLGTGEHGTNEALFLRSFTRNITLIAPRGRHELSDAERSTLSQGSVDLVDGPALISIEAEAVITSIGDRSFRFDTLYPALGSAIRSELAAELGAACSDEGCLLVDEHMRTSVPGLYAAGDVVKGLDQISHAVGEGGVAATTIRNDLADRLPLFR
jgi:thioredoxin reductase (NADPH)